MSDSRRKVVYAKKLALADLDSISGGAANTMVRAGEVPRRVDEVLRGTRTSLTDPSLLDALDPSNPFNPNGRIMPRTPTVRDPSGAGLRDPGGVRDPSGAQRVSDALNDVTGDRDRGGNNPRVTPRVTTPHTTTPERITGNVPLPTPRPAAIGGPFTGRESEAAVGARLGDERFRPATQTFDDGSTLTRHLNGTYTSTIAPEYRPQVFDDGSTLTKNPNGTYSSTIAPEYRPQIFDDGSTLTKNPNGSYSSTIAPEYQPQVFDDGSTLTKNADGGYSSTPAPADYYAPPPAPTTVPTGNPGTMLASETSGAGTEFQTTGLGADAGADTGLPAVDPTIDPNNALV